MNNARTAAINYAIANLTENDELDDAAAMLADELAEIDGVDADGLFAEALEILSAQ